MYKLPSKFLVAAHAACGSCRRSVTAPSGVEDRKSYLLANQLWYGRSVTALREFFREKRAF